MYEVIIYTNIKELPMIHLNIEDLQDEQFIEIINQPYVVEVVAHKVEQLKRRKI